MKFSDGMWLMRPGITSVSPIEVDSVVTDETSMTVYAATNRVNHRGDTLGHALLTLTFTAVAEGIITVRAVHLDGGIDHGPRLDLSASTYAGAKVEVADTEATLTSGSLSVRVARQGSWAVTFFDHGQPVTSSLGKSLAFMDVPPDVVSDGRTLASGGMAHGPYVREQLTLDVGEKIYGLGERFGAFVKNGQSIDIWNADGGTTSDQAYKSVPFYLSSAGYGVLVNHFEKVSFEVASESVETVQFSVPGQRVEYAVIAGPTPKEVLRRYTGLTGRAPLVPAWSYGTWLSTSFTTQYDEATVNQAIEAMADHGLNLSVFHFDCFWMREYQWCDFEWDPRVFPDPVGMLKRLHDRGLKVCVWINPYIGQRSPLFAEGARLGYLLRRANGDVWQWDEWQAGMGLVDLTNPEAKAWWTGKLAGLLDMGVDCFKTDFGERIPVEDVVWFDGSDPMKMHNAYAGLYNGCVYDLLVERRGVGDAVVFARCATTGGQQYPVHWGGDSWSTFASMAETLRGGLSFAMSGFAYWSHDIGGFEGTPPADVFTRWLAFGLFSSHSRFHGSGSMRLPWLYGDTAVEATRLFSSWKMRLMPYLGMCARQARDAGTPLMRPMVMEFPDDRAVRDIDTQYMLGPSLLVAPVFSSDGSVEFYLPRLGGRVDRWTSLLDGSTLTGSGWVRQTHDLTSLPLMVRPDTVLPLGARDDRPEYDWADGVTLWCHELADGHDETVVIPACDAGVGATDATFRIRRARDTITVDTDSDRTWSVRVGDHQVTNPAGTAHVEVNTI